MNGPALRIVRFLMMNHCTATPLVASLFVSQISRVYSAMGLDFQRNDMAGSTFDRERLDMDLLAMECAALPYGIAKALSSGHRRVGDERLRSVWSILLIQRAQVAAEVARRVRYGGVEYSYEAELGVWRAASRTRVAVRCGSWNPMPWGQSSGFRC